MDVCACVRAWVYIYIYIYVCACVFVNVCLCACAYLFVFAFVFGEDGGEVICNGISIVFNICVQRHGFIVEEEIEEYYDIESQKYTGLRMSKRVTPVASTDSTFSSLLKFFGLK